MVWEMAVLLVTTKFSEPGSVSGSTRMGDFGLGLGIAILAASSAENDLGSPGVSVDRSEDGAGLA